MRHLLPLRNPISTRLILSRWRELLLAALLVSSTSTVQAQTTSPFQCTAGKSYLFQTDNTTGVEVDVSTGKTTSATSAAIIPASAGNQKLNAFGYNQRDNYIWGVRVGSNQLVQVGSDFKANIYGVTGLSTDGANAVVGDVSPAGTMYLTRGGSAGGGSSSGSTASAIYTIDLTQTLTSTNPNYQATLLAYTTPSYINDWAVSPKDGHLYALYATISAAGNASALTLYRFLTSPMTVNGTVQPVGTRQTLGTLVPDNSAGATNPITGSNYASCFMDATGNFYVASSDNGYIYRINSPDATPLNLTAYYIGTGPSGTLNNDGARCPNTSIAPLPVTLVSFGATVAPNRSVQLAWATANEQNNDFFEVQHSLDGRTFTALGKVAGHQTTTQAATYSFTDATPGPEATHYYRLRQTDLDGTSTFSPVRAVRLAAGSSPVQLVVAPNPTPPASLRVQVQYAGPAATLATLTVQSLLGQTVLTQLVTLAPGSNELIPGGVLAPGAYWLSLSGEAVGQQGQRVLVGE